jgi:hypothetical protein
MKQITRYTLSLSLSLSSYTQKHFRLDIVVLSKVANKSGGLGGEGKEVAIVFCRLKKTKKLEQGKRKQKILSSALSALNETGVCFRSIDGSYHLLN